MKKLIIAAALAVSFAANAASSVDTELCGLIAENTAAVVRLQKLDTPWAEVEAILVHKTTQKSAYGQKLGKLLISIQQEAYYSWHSFEPAQIKQLAFMKCQIGMLSL